MLTGIGHTIYVFAWVFPLKAELLGSRGRDAEGTVQHKTSDQGKNSRWSATVQFTDDAGQTRIFDEEYNEQDWKRLEVGRTVRLRYLAGDSVLVHDLNSNEIKTNSPMVELIWSWIWIFFYGGMFAWYRANDLTRDTDKMRTTQWRKE